MTRAVVSVYLVDREFGGREEGGWWYDTGEHVKTCRIFPNEKAACKYATRYNALLSVFVNRGRRSIGSVLSQGEYRAVVTDDPAPRCWPESRPYYE